MNQPDLYIHFKNCSYKLLNSFSRYLSPNPRNLILRTAVENGGQAEWDFAFNCYKATGGGACLVAMTCTSDITIINT